MERLYNVFWKSPSQNTAVVLESSEECTHSSRMSRSTHSSTSSYSYSSSYTSSSSSLVPDACRRNSKFEIPVKQPVPSSSNSNITLKSNKSIPTPKQLKNKKCSQFQTNLVAQSNKCLSSSSKTSNETDNTFVNNGYLPLCEKLNSARKSKLKNICYNDTLSARCHSNSSINFSCKEDEQNSIVRQTNNKVFTDKKSLESCNNNSFVSDRQVNSSFSASLPALSSSPICVLHKENSMHRTESNVSTYSNNQSHKRSSTSINTRARESFTSMESNEIDSVCEHEHRHKVKHSESNSRQVLPLCISSRVKDTQRSTFNSMQRLRETRCGAYEINDRTVNILVIGTPESGKSSFINTYRECVAFHGRWPAAPVGACGGAGTLTVEPFPDNVSCPSWLCIDTPGTIYNVYHEQALRTLETVNRENINSDEGKVTQTLLNFNFTPVQNKYISNSVLLKKLFAGMPWHIRLAGKNKITDDEVARLPTIEINSAHQCIIVIAATELITDLGWSRWLLRKPRYVALQTKIGEIELNRQHYEFEEYCKINESPELECINKKNAGYDKEMERIHRKENQCQSSRLPVTSPLIEAITNEVLPSLEQEDKEPIQRFNQHELIEQNALFPLAEPIKMVVHSATLTSKQATEEAGSEKRLKDSTNKASVLVKNVTFVEYLKHLIMYIREITNDYIPHIVITKMDCVGGAGCMESRQAIAELLSRCISSNHIHFISNRTLANNIASFDSFNSLNIDFETRQECLQLHHRLSLELAWRMRINAYNN